MVKQIVSMLDTTTIVFPIIVHSQVECGKIARQTARIYSETFPDRVTFILVAQKFKETDSVYNHRQSFKMKQFVRFTFCEIK